ncbi:hypothetical protein ANASTE_00695 [Anaerofustis stercorihominis DSM 17244]|uniref:Uncharacterized protein n=1 Tax=Anaerofustis stercorihominis DSM 17244 TaxID=445971 RepID=B1C7J3_9FIRM|nr:hypothetical protein ANASTE_00695 [Anaerofustis stercorihominis DSM 17244]
MCAYSLFILWDFSRPVPTEYFYYFFFFISFYVKQIYFYLLLLKLKLYAGAKQKT